MKKTAALAVGISLVAALALASMGCSRAATPPPVPSGTSPSAVGTQTAVATPTSAPQVLATIVGTAPPGPTTSATRPAAGTATAAPAATATQAPATTPISALAITILEPADESMVDTSPLTIRGRTDPAAVVSINGEMVDLDANGNFSFQATLEEGPNIFDIIASDEEGNDVTRQLVVFYSPAP